MGNDRNAIFLIKENRFVSSVLAIVYHLEFISSDFVLENAHFGLVGTQKRCMADNKYFRTASNIVVHMTRDVTSHWIEMCLSSNRLYSSRAVQVCGVPTSIRPARAVSHRP